MQIHFQTGMTWTYICIFHSKNNFTGNLPQGKKNEWKVIYLFCLAKLTPVKTPKSESSPIQQVNNVCLGNVFATLMGFNQQCHLCFSLKPKDETTFAE